MVAGRLSHQVDKYPTSPYVDNIYMTWQALGIMWFARSGEFGDTWSSQMPSTIFVEDGIGSNIVTDNQGRVYYFWPAYESQAIIMRRSTDGGQSFEWSRWSTQSEASYTFAIPAMDRRKVWVYLVADAILNDVIAVYTDLSPSMPTPARSTT